MTQVTVRRYIDGRLVDEHDRPVGIQAIARLIPQVAVPKATRIEQAAQELAGLPARVKALEERVARLDAMLRRRDMPSRPPSEPVASLPGQRRRAGEPLRHSIYRLHEMEVGDRMFFTAAAAGVSVHLLRNRISATCVNWARQNPERFSTKKTPDGVWIERTR